MNLMMNPYNERFSLSGRKFPRSIEKVDAVYERPLSKKIVFFIGDLYYEFTGNRVDSGFPKSIQSLGENNLTE